MSNTVIFQVLENLVLATDTSVATLVKHQGRKKDGTKFDFVRWEAPVTIDGVQVGNISSYDYLPKSRLYQGKRIVSKMFSWTYKEWQSVTMEEVEKAYGKAFWEGTTVNEKGGKTHHKLGFSKRDGNKNITIWLYKDLFDEKEQTYRAQVVIEFVTYADPKSL